MGKSAAGLAFYAYVIPVPCFPNPPEVQGISGVLIYSLKKANILCRYAASNGTVEEREAC